MMYYSKAIFWIWKEFFSKICDFFKFFFTFAQRNLQKMDKGCEPVNSLSEQRGEVGAERCAVEHGAREREQDRIEPGPSGAGAQPQQEQPREHDQRIQHIQRRPAERAAFCARCAQRVEHQPEREAQGRCQRREHRLVRYRGSHPKSLDQKPSPRCGVSA